ncbi:hypothetical protein LOS15_15720 [Halomonas sp. 7T]|uniref:hypothetical protein n=1 Tax=Halomonas sp. 7T TaxID=2893469 RepID=UPI0021D9AD6B|nr:hypothetical protein [Halomonas sp. 7T]UXZ54237.1 hypothetical protein LOS15_15720 [Halomonas sp. 7T]
MKWMYWLSLLLIAVCPPVLANPAPFGMPIGELSIQEAEAQLSLRPAGTNEYSGGRMFTAPVAQFSFEGLQEMTLVFDQDEQLVAVLATLNKQRFDALFNGLSERYRLFSSQRPFVGNKMANFEAGNTEIHLDSPHLSFQMTLSYLEKGFLSSFREKSSNAERRQQQHEMNQL